MRRNEEIDPRWHQKGVPHHHGDAGDRTTEACASDPITLDISPGPGARREGVFLAALAGCPSFMGAGADGRPLLPPWGSNAKKCSENLRSGSRRAKRTRTRGFPGGLLAHQGWRGAAGKVGRLTMATGQASGTRFQPPTKVSGFGLEATAAPQGHFAGEAHVLAPAMSTLSDPPPILMELRQQLRDVLTNIGYCIAGGIGSEEQVARHDLSLLHPDEATTARLSRLAETLERIAVDAELAAAEAVCHHCLDLGPPIERES